MEKTTITIDMEKEFLKAQIKNDGMVSKMAFTCEGILLPAKDLYKAMLIDLEELEEKKNEDAMPIEAYEKRLTESNETISRLLKENKNYENTIDKLQQVIVAQATQLLDAHTGNKKMKEYIEKLLENSEDEK